MVRKLNGFFQNVILFIFWLVRICCNSWSQLLRVLNTVVKAELLLGV